jgi:hypothetical protein
LHNLHGVSTLRSRTAGDSLWPDLYDAQIIVAQCCRITPVVKQESDVKKVVLLHAIQTCRGRGGKV